MGNDDTSDDAKRYETCGDQTDFKAVSGSEITVVQK